MDTIAPEEARVIDQLGAADSQGASTSGALGSFQELADELALVRNGGASAGQTPKTAEDGLTTGFTHLERGAYAEAHSAFEAATTLRPDLAIAHGCCALALQFMQRPEEARKAASIALALDPDDLVSLKVLARIQLDEGRIVEVVRTCLHIQKINPEDQDARSMLNQANALYFGRPTTGSQGEECGAVEPDSRSGGHDDGAAQGLPRFDVGRPIDLDWGLSLEIGRCSYIHDCRIRNPAKAKTHIRIGKFCSIATDLTIIGYDHRTDWITTYPFLDPWNRAFWPGTTDIASQADPEIGGNRDRGGVEIGNDVWIGYNVKLFKGVKIGDGAVIGACSLVRRDVPPFTIVAGSPARVIRQRFSDADRDFLLGIRWWDWPAEKINRMLPLLCADGVTALRQALEAQTQTEA